jgi:hypothetical protein
LIASGVEVVAKGYRSGFKEKGGSKCKGGSTSELEDDEVEMDAGFKVE